MVTALLVSVLVVQGDPPRPALSGRDLNDWQSYFDAGADALKRYPNRADSLFAWASRVDPSRAEPFAARWVAFWMRDISRFERYLDERASPFDSVLIRQADTLLLRALERNPLVPQTLLLLPYEQLPGDWEDNSLTLGWLAYSRQQWDLAASHFAQVIRSNPKKMWVHYDRALTFVPRHEFDSAAVEMSALLAALRAREDSSMSPVYQSKELIAYGIALLHDTQGHRDSAQRFFEQALLENLAFFPAEAELGDLALTQRDTASALRHFGQAAQLAPLEAWIQERYGVALLRAGRSIDALDPLQRAIKLDPWYADSYLMLGLAWADAGDKDAAAQAFQQYLERAPRRDQPAIDDVKRRLARLHDQRP